MKDLTETLFGLSKEDRKRICYIASKIHEMLPTTFTYDPLTDSEPKFKGKYFEQLFCVSKKSVEPPFKKKPTLAQVKIWVCKHYEQICIAGNYIGYWAENGLFYLDITIVVFGEARALEIALLNQQISIYHPASGDTVYVNKKHSKAS